VRADRLLSILLLLQARGRMTTRDLSGRLEVSRRTVFRDLEALSVAGVPVVTERGPEGGVYLLEGYRTDLTGLTEAELEALFAFSGSGLAADLGMKPELDRASHKVSAAAGRPLTVHPRQRVLVDTQRWGAPPAATPHLGTVQDAVWAERRLRLLYQGPGQRAREVLVDPYGLVAKAGRWYLLGAVDGSLRTYRISRIEEAAMLSEGFERPSGFDLETAWTAQVAGFLPGDRHEVEVRVPPETAALFARVMGDSMSRPIQDGGAHVEFPSLGAAAAVLAGFGGMVEVLAPPALRAQLAELGRQLVETYGRPAPVTGRDGPAGASTRRRTGRTRS
jgi:predicted DNA-binding transcriptional regulator YafY